MTVGLCVGSLAAAALWWQRQGALRPLAGALGLVGAGVGAVVAARKRWSDEHVALYLDEKLDSQERIVTALGVRRDEGEAARSEERRVGKEWRSRWRTC